MVARKDRRRKMNPLGTCAERVANFHVDWSFELLGYEHNRVDSVLHEFVAVRVVLSNLEDSLNVPLAVGLNCRPATGLYRESGHRQKDRNKRIDPLSFCRSPSLFGENRHGIHPVNWHSSLLSGRKSSTFFYPYIFAIFRQKV